MSQRRPSVDELEQLDGIGPKQVECSRPLLKTDGETERKQPLARPRAESSAHSCEDDQLRGAVTGKQCTRRVVSRK